MPLRPRRLLMSWHVPLHSLFLHLCQGKHPSLPCQLLSRSWIPDRSRKLQPDHHGRVVYITIELQISCVKGCGRVDSGAFYPIGPGSIPCLIRDRNGRFYWGGSGRCEASDHIARRCDYKTTRESAVHGTPWAVCLTDHGLDVQSGITGAPVIVVLQP